MRKTRPAGSDQSGMPDLTYCLHGRSGYMELKYRPSWPKRASTPVRINLTPVQRLWLKIWTDAGGTGLVLVGVDADWYLFDGEVENAIDQDVLRRNTHPNLITTGRIDRAGWQHLLTTLLGGC